MNVLQIRVRSWDESREEWLVVGRRLDRDEEGPFGQFYTFSSIERLLDMLAPNRWALLEALLGEEPMSLRALARKGRARRQGCAHGCSPPHGLRARGEDGGWQAPPLRRGRHGDPRRLHGRR